MATVAEIRAKALARLAILKGQGEQHEQRAEMVGGPVSSDEFRQSAGSTSAENGCAVRNTDAGSVSAGCSETVDAGVGQVGTGTAGGTSNVVTELQPTALVVVERPPAVEVAATLSSGTAAVGGTATQLDHTNPVHAGFLQRLGELEAALLTRDPLMKTHLKVIHQTMIAEEEIVNLLSVQEISKIMAAQQVFTNTVLARDVAKAAKTKNSSKAAQISLDDV